MKKVHNIIFDLGGVVILKGDFDFEKFDKKFSLPPGKTREIMSLCLEKLNLGKELDLEEFLENKFSPIFNIKRFEEVVSDLDQKEELNKELMEWIKTKRKDYRVSILTNNTLKLEGLLKTKFGIYDDFDFVFNSAEIGFRKPDPRIFRYALKKINAAPKECLFVDDTAVHVEQAKKMGFHTILFLNNEQLFKEIDEILN